jgi:hypothetical protein
MERISELRFSSEETVAAALDRYLGENGFTHAAYEEAWTHASFLGIPLVVPNTRRHRQGIRLHDLHHVATGFGTDLAGEGEVSAWELGAGLRGVGFYVGAIVCAGGLLGLLAAPRRALRAFRLARAARARTLWSPLADHTPGFARYEALLRLRVGELREGLGMPAEGLLDRGSVRRLHGLAPSPIENRAPSA